MKAERPPMVDNWLQRTTDSWLHFILWLDQQLSPKGHLRQWVLQNARLGAWLLMPAIIVMPIIGLILWQMDGWLSMLTHLFGRLLALPLLLLLMHRIFTALIKR